MAYQQKGYLKIHIKVDIEKNGTVREKNVKEISRYASENNNLKGILEDGMYDSNNNFRCLSKPLHQIWRKDKK